MVGNNPCSSAASPTVPPQAMHCMSWGTFWASGMSTCALTGTGSLKFSGRIYFAGPARTLLLWQLTPPSTCLMISLASCTTSWNSMVCMGRLCRSWRLPLARLCAPRSDKGTPSVRWTSSKQTCSTTALVSAPQAHTNANSLCATQCVCVCVCMRSVR